MFFDTLNVVQRLTLVGPVDGFTGYGLHLTKTVEYLTAMGVFASVRAVQCEEKFGVRLPRLLKERLVHCPQPESWEIIIAPPTVPCASGKRTLYFTMWESSEVLDSSVKILNRAAAICVPCHWNREVLRASGVTRPIYIVPLGIDESDFKFKPMPMDGPCVFGVAGRLAHGVRRKGVLEIMDLFLEAFPDNENVQLHVKVHPDCPVPSSMEWSWLKMTKAHLDKSDLLNWYHNLTAFVSGATAEGWGLMQQEAMACGRPVIGAVYGGLREFMNPKNCFPVEYEEGKAADGYPGNWAVLDRASLVRQMRQVYQNREKAAEVGRRAAASASRFTWRNSVDRLMVVLEAVQSGAPPPEPSWEPDRTRYITVWPPPAKTQLETMGFEHGVFAFPDKERYYFNTAAVDYSGKRLLFSRSAICDPQGNRIDNKIEVHKWVQGRLEKVTEVLPAGRGWIEDPRAMVVNGHIYLSYTRVHDNQAKQEFAQLDSDFQLGQQWIVPHGRNAKAGPEKNWIWFYNEGTWQFFYELKPLTTVYPDARGGISAVTEVHGGLEAWQFGRPRGGTTPVKIGDEFLAFFHSSLPWATGHRKYYVGAFTWSAIPPYKVTSVTPQPILAGHPTDPKRNIGTHANVFPMGLLEDGEDWLVTMGVNDEQSLWCKFPKRWLGEVLWRA